MALNGIARSIGRTMYRAPDELASCPACSSADLVALDTHKLQEPIDGRRTGLITGCHECGLVFVNPMPREGDLSHMYGPEGEWARERADESAAGEPSPSVVPGAGSWRRLFEGATFDVTRPAAGARVLDFGCGRGKFLDVLQPCGWETFGIEPAMDAAFPRHHRLDAIPAVPTFDLTIAHHVLEHVRDPLSLLKQLAAASRPGGYLLIAVPRLDTLPLHRDRSYVISRVHITSYTSACMTTLLRRAGWEPVRAPEDEVAISGGRRTTARLRMLARRTEAPAPLPDRPLDAARTALREYGRTGGRSAAARLGGARLAARITESTRTMRRWRRILESFARRVTG